MLELKSLIKYRLESIEHEEVNNLESLAFNAMEKDVQLDQRFCELFSDRKDNEELQIDVVFQLREMKLSKVVTEKGFDISEIRKYRCIPDPVTLFRM